MGNECGQNVLYTHITHTLTEKHLYHKATRCLSHLPPPYPRHGTRRPKLAEAARALAKVAAVRPLPTRMSSLPRLYRTELPHQEASWRATSHTSTPEQPAPMGPWPGPTIRHAEGWP